MARVTFKVKYDARASENMMNRVWNPKTRRKGHGLTREARAWRDSLSLLIEPFAEIFGPTTRVSFQIVSNGKARGDTANFTKLGLDAIARGLHLPSDCRISCDALPRVREDTEESYIRLILENDDDKLVCIPNVRLDNL